MALLPDVCGCQGWLWVGSAIAASLLPSHLRQGEAGAGRLPDPSSVQALGSVPTAAWNSSQALTAQAVVTLPVVTGPCLLLSPLHHCSLTVWLRKFCISRRPHAFRFSSGVTSYSACRVRGKEA